MTSMEFRIPKKLQDNKNPTVLTSIQILRLEL